MKKVFTSVTLSLLVSLTVFGAEVHECPRRIVTSEQLNLQNPESLKVVDPRNLSDPDSILSRHVRYMKTLLEQGEILETGAIEDLNGNVLEGFTVFFTDDLSRATRLQNADPFVQNAIVNLQYKRWKRCESL